MIRIIAILMLIMPGVAAAIGIKLMRDTLFNDFYSIFFNGAIQFMFGLLLFIGGVAFLGGFIIYRDRKQQRKKNEEETDSLQKDG